jgi:hypothetical protein
MRELTTQISAPPDFHDGFTATIGTGHMASLSSGFGSTGTTGKCTWPAEPVPPTLARKVLSNVG